MKRLLVYRGAVIATAVVFFGCSRGAQGPQPSGATIDLSSASGSVGEVVTIEATLGKANGQITALSTDIVYDSTQASVALRSDGKPDCTINPTIGSETPVGKQVIASQPGSPADARVLRIGVLGFDNANAIPDGKLFSCRFQIERGAPPGTKRLKNIPAASSAAAKPLGVSGAEGSITVR